MVFESLSFLTAPHSLQMGSIGSAMYLSGFRSIFEMVEQHYIHSQIIEGSLFAMEDNKVFLLKLKGLASIINYGQQGYKSAAKATYNHELKYLFQKYVEQRSLFESQLKIHFEYLVNNLDDQEHKNLVEIRRIWNAINEAVISRNDLALLWALTTGEQTVLEKFEIVIQNNQLDQDHLNLLTNQKNEIAGAIKKMEFLRLKYSDKW